VLARYGPGLACRLRCSRGLFENRHAGFQGSLFARQIACALLQSRARARVRSARPAASATQGQHHSDSHTRSS
jgi:hypothetical protein